MGCGGSSASDPSDEKIDWKNAEIDDEFNQDTKKGKKKRFNKKTGKVEDKREADDREFDFFEGADAGSGEQFMAVRPYEGAIVEPTNHNEPSSSAPDVSYDLEYVYGYRCEDSRMNCFYNKDGHATYFTAALGVILDHGSNTQKFFGGGQTDNTSKKVARDNDSHTNDVTGMGISHDRSTCVTGQNGKYPVAFAWCSSEGKKKARFKIEKKHCREITTAAVCPKNKLVALVDGGNDHNIWIYDIDSGSKLKSEKTGGDKIYHSTFTLEEGKLVVALAGSKHFSLWDIDASKFKKTKGLYMGKGNPTSHCCVAMDDKGNSYTGGANSHIYVWEGRELKEHYDVHGKGFVCAIKWSEGKIISGAKDGKVVVSDPSTQSAERTIDVDSLVRSVDFHGGKILAGLRNGTILEICEKNNKTEVMKSHSTGEAWGLALTGDGHFVTAGDDNKAITWSIGDRKSVDEAELCAEACDAKAGGASSLTDFPDSQCGRAVAVNTHGNNHVAIGHNDGRVTIRSSATSLSSVTHTLQDSAEWIECMSYSPCGGKLAVGSHDNKIYVYDSSSYELLGKCTKHNSFIVSVDWSQDGKFIRSVCGAHELLFFDGESFEQDTSGASNTVETEWQTSSAKYGWLVSGIFPAATDGTHINHVDFSSDSQHIVTSDDYGLVNVWRNPARKGATPVSLRGHSEHVVRSYFTSDDGHIISIGGYDKTIMQWKKK